MTSSNGIEIFSTCPQSKDCEPGEYLQRVVDVARWSDEAGYSGILVYTDNGIADPWLVSQVILQNTEALAPLVAVQPIYMHPYTAAKLVSTLALLHDRRVLLNMLAGGFKNDLAALNDETPHDDRYLRTVEYTLIIAQLLRGRDAVTFDGRYYKVTNLRLAPSLPSDLFPGIFISGSSEAGLAAARRIGATAVKYPKPPGEEDDQREEDLDCGVRVGVIARETHEQAWNDAYERFPEDRKGQLAHGLAMKVSDSQWHKQLSELGDREPEESPYWLGPFQNYKTFCPYLVGTYGRVGEELARYIDNGYTTFILDIPPSYEELHHTAEAFRRARELSRD
jgi:alkanesulfonate monooxygenase